jgi:hypothetical protein
MLSLKKAAAAGAAAGTLKEGHCDVRCMLSLQQQQREQQQCSSLFCAAAAPLLNPTTQTPDAADTKN